MIHHLTTERADRRGTAGRAQRDHRNDDRFPWSAHVLQLARRERARSFWRDQGRPTSARHGWRRDRSA